MDFAGHLVLLNEIEASVNMFKQASAVLTLLKELVGLETVIGSSIVKTVKRGCIKSARDRVAKKGKKERTVMTIDHVKLLIGRFYKKPAQLKNFCLRNDIPVLTLHSVRRGGVTLTVECGIDKMTIKKVGNWTSEAVDGYFMPKKAGVDFTSKALKRL